jgi:hypothetical protein
MGVMTTSLDRVARFVLRAAVKERKFKPTGEKHSFDELLPPDVPPHLKPFVTAA